MGGHLRQRPVWRAFGACLSAFAIGVQLLLSGWLIGQAAAAVAGGPDEFLVICTHDSPAAADESSGAPAQKPHGQCPDCACPQSAKLIGAPPALPDFVVLAPPSRALPVVTADAPADRHVRSPYASRAPPLSA